MASKAREVELQEDLLEAAVANIATTETKVKNLSEHSSLLRDDLLDLNLLESQMYTTLEQCNFGPEKVAEKILFRKAKALGFKSG